MVDNMGVGIGGWGLGGMTGMGGVEGNSRDGRGCATRNSSVVGMLSSRLNKVLSFQTRLPINFC